jgi:hypothetical protein
LEGKEKKRKEKGWVFLSWRFSFLGLCRTLWRIYLAKICYGEVWSVFDDDKMLIVCIFIFFSIKFFPIEFFDPEKKKKKSKKMRQKKKCLVKIGGE